MANKRHNRVLIIILSILLLVSCSMDLFANGNSESSTEAGSSIYSSTTTYSSNITTVLDAENL